MATPVLSQTATRSLSTTSQWLANAGLRTARDATKFPPLSALSPAPHYDVCVVGGGIFGCTAALLLKKAGKRVCLLEARNIGGGTTGFSTAKLTSQQNLIYSALTKLHPKQTAALYHEMNEEAIDYAENLVNELKMDVEWSRRAHTTWTSEEKKAELIRKEFQTCVEIGVKNVKLVSEQELLTELPASIQPKLGVSFANQAQFNSYKFCVQLADRIHGQGCDVFENTLVTDVSNSAPHTVRVGEDGAAVTSDHVVLATHLPIMDRSMHFAILEPSRSHCIAVRVDNAKQKSVLHNMFINADMPMRSMRPGRSDTDDIVVIAGETVKQGDDPDTNKFYLHLETWAKQHFHVTEVLTRWSAMDYFSTDHLPYIGYLYRGSNTIFTATGMSKWGLANGVAGARIVTDLILGRENKYHAIVDARRWDVTGTAGGMALEGWHTVKHLVGDKVKHAFSKRDIKELKVGEGDIVKAGSQTVGAYLDENGQYHVVKPQCTHLGCDLVFNTGDKVWDCPCHGSQFDIHGKVLHGPACKNLCQIKDLEW